jgi:hypothetical protein
MCMTWEGTRDEMRREVCDNETWIINEFPETSELWLSFEKSHCLIAHSMSF